MDAALSRDGGSRDTLLGSADGGSELHDARTDGGAVDAGLRDGSSVDHGTLARPCLDPGGFGFCALGGWPGRGYRVFRPAGHDPQVPTPVVLMLHGGGGNALSAIAASCPEDQLGHPACWHRVAAREGFVVVYPEGTDFPQAPGRRTWNAGGGVEPWLCVSAGACQTGVDDLRFFTDLLEALQDWMRVDEGALFATGLSNGAAMAHRLACEMGERIAAIAPVGGANQWAATAPCEPGEPVAILQIHGTSDPCWTYEETEASCSGPLGLKVGARESTEGWATRWECEGEPASENELDTDGDGLKTTVLTWPRCQASVRLLRLEGAGHTYPNGRQYQPESEIGPTLRDWGSERIWAFFDAHRR